MAETIKAMPDFCAPTRGVRHTVDSAVSTLLRLGVEMDRIILKSAGAGWIRGTVVGQLPKAGEPISSRVELSVAGTGAIESLPFPMRDGAEGEFRIDRLVALFDTPLLRLSLHLRAAGGLLDLHPDDPEGANRWIVDIFRLSAEPFPRARWYDLARLLPALPRIAGRPDGPALALQAVFRLPASRVRVIPGIAPVATDRRTRLGRWNGRLGVDAIVGDGVTASTSAEIDIGPVDLATYRLHESGTMRRQREALYRLVLPAHFQRGVRERWRVGSADQPARLGDHTHEAALGINSYLGGSGARSAA